MLHCSLHAASTSLCPWLGAVSMPVYTIVTTAGWVLCPCQVYTIVTTAVDGSSPPGRTAVCELLDRLQEPVPYLQALFQPISSRVSQVKS